MLYNYLVDTLRLSYIVTEKSWRDDIRLYYPNLNITDIVNEYNMYNQIRQDIDSSLKKIQRVHNAPKSHKLQALKDGYYEPVVKVDIRKAFTTMFHRIIPYIENTRLQRIAEYFLDVILNSGMSKFTTKFLLNYLVTNILIRSDSFTLNDIRDIIYVFIKRLSEKINSQVIATEIDGLYYIGTTKFSNIKSIYVTQTDYKWLYKNKYIRVLFNSRIKFDSYNRLTPNVILLFLKDVVYGNDVYQTIDKYFKYHQARIIDYGIKSDNGEYVSLVMKNSIIRITPDDNDISLYNYLDYDYLLDKLYTKYFELIEILYAKRLHKI